MKKIVFAALVALVLHVAHASAQTTQFAFEDIPLWFGSGSNQAAMVVQWNDDNLPVSLVWGYRWDGSATSLDMFQAIDAGNSDFSSTLTDHGWGISVDGIGYAEGSRFKPGWDGTNYWAFYTSEGSPYGGSGAWASSFVGIGDRSLSDGSWDGWSHSPGNPSDAPVVPLAVPEPSTASFIVIGGLLLLRRLGRR